MSFPRKRESICAAAFLDPRFRGVTEVGGTRWSSRQTR